MVDDKEILKKLNDIQNKIEDIELEINNKKNLRERPLNFWEFLLEVEWLQVFGFILVLAFMFGKI